MNHTTTLIRSLDEFIKRTNKDINESWDFGCNIAWFRGENKENVMLHPKLYKVIKRIKDKNKKKSFENDIIQEFRMRAVALMKTPPDYCRIDEWLFLMQHTFLPTRLLDWTESSLFALFFAINETLIDKKKYTPVVWMLNPVIFNFIASKRFFLPLSWADGSNNYKKEKPNNLELDKSILYDNDNYNKDEYILKECPSNILAAFEAGRCKFEEKYPIALKPQHIHPRVTAQRGCFTIHGSITDGIQNMFNNKTIENLITEEHIQSLKSVFNKELFDKPESIIKKIRKKYSNSSFNEVFLLKYTIDPDKKIIRNILKELKNAGIGYSTLFPDLDGLSRELSNIF